MSGFHQSAAFFVPVSDMEKACPCIVESESEATLFEEAPRKPRQQRQLLLISLLFLAQAIMESSLSSEITALLPSGNGCLASNAVFVENILECAYFFGNGFGIFWGNIVDQYGRRKVVLIGLGGMAAVCTAMSFATSISALVLLRSVAGVVSSATTIAGLAALGDRTHGNGGQTEIVARLPLIAVCGSTGPLLASSIFHLADSRSDLFSGYPLLPSQMVCAILVMILALVEALYLEESLPTLPTPLQAQRMEDDDDTCDLSQPLLDDPEREGKLTLIEALNDSASTSALSHISVLQLLTAPSVLTLLASYSIFSLHSSALEILLPHVGHRSSHVKLWLGLVRMIVKVVAAVHILKYLPFAVGRIGLLKLYRTATTAFPFLYTLVPLLALLVDAFGYTTIPTAVVSIVAMLVKHALTWATQVLMLQLVLTAVPDAHSTGAVLGVMSISELFKALAVGVSGMCYCVTTSESLVMVDSTLWAILTLITISGALITVKLRETPRVGTDIPSECLVWEGMFDINYVNDSGA